MRRFVIGGAIWEFDIGMTLDQGSRAFRIAQKHPLDLHITSAMAAGVASGVAK
jgi:hypothetical protein